MSTGQKSAKLEIAGKVISTSPGRPRVTASKKELRAAIDRLWIEMHSSKHPLDKIRLYEEIKMIENEISSLGEAG